MRKREDEYVGCKPWALYSQQLSFPIFSVCMTCVCNQEGKKTVLAAKLLLNIVYHVDGF